MVESRKSMVSSLKVGGTTGRINKFDCKIDELDKFGIISDIEHVFC